MGIKIKKLPKLEVETAKKILDWINKSVENKDLRDKAPLVTGAMTALMDYSRGGGVEASNVQLSTGGARGDELSFSLNADKQRYDISFGSDYIKISDKRGSTYKIE